MTGQPWPIQFYVTANPGQFDVKAPGCDEAGNCKVGANMVMVTPLIAHAQGNLVITLRDQPVPVTVDLRVGNRAGADFKASVADARLDLRIPGMGPNAVPPLVEASSLHQPDDQRMLAFLDGVPPQQAQQVHVSGLADVQAWRLGKTIYVRTPYAMLSPAWIEHVRGVSGMLIYAIEETPVLLLSAHGSVVTVSLGS
jgi:intracellular multiplication protein IcmK